MIWSNDDPELCAIQERKLICILRNAQPERRHACKAALCSFADLEVKVTVILHCHFLNSEICMMPPPTLQPLNKYPIPFQGLRS